MTRDITRGNFTTPARSISVLERDAVKSGGEGGGREKSSILKCVVFFVFIAASISVRSVASNTAAIDQRIDITSNVVQGDAVWKERSSASLPPERTHHAMAYDSERGVTVLFGGHNNIGVRLNDTWEWDGNDWVQRFPSNTPSARDIHRMAYDEARGVTLLFGGYRGGNNILSDTWQWNGNDWTQRFPDINPPARWGHALVYDRARERVVLFGGWNGNGRLNDTWEWDGTNWTQCTPSDTPPEMYGHALTYDSIRERVVLFGGWTTKAIDETWEWDGTNWIRRFPTTIPSARAYHALAYDSRRRRVVLFGGSNSIAGGTANPSNDTWEWNGVNWTQRFQVSPPERFIHTLVYDNRRGRSVLFGGGNQGRSALRDTWEYGPAFILSATPITHVVAPGTSAAYNISVTQGLVSSTVNLTLTGLPPGSVGQFKPTLVTPPAQAILTVTTSITTPLGFYPSTIAGSGSGFTNTIQVTTTVTKADFWLSCSTPEQTIYQGQNAAYTITLDVTPLFTSAVTLDLTDVPSGTSSLLVPPVIAPGDTAMLTVTTGISTPIGTHRLVILGTGSGLTRTADLTLTIQPADITLSAIPSVQTLYQGQSVSYTLDLTATPGFEQPVILAANIPPDVFSTLSPTVLWPGQSATLAITTELPTLTGTHTVKVQGASSGLSDTATVTLNILPAAINLTTNPSSRTAYQGQSTSYALTLTATPGLTIPVKLSTSAISGTVGMLDPAVLWPEETTTLTLTPSLTTPEGSYPMLITGTGVMMSGTIHLAFTATAQVSLTTLPANFALEIAPSACTVFQGQVASFVIGVESITPSFSWPITLAIGDIPSNTFFNLNPSKVKSGTQATLFVTTTENTPPDTYELSITGTVNGIERSTKTTLQVSSRIFLPIVLKRWPPLPFDATLNPIENPDGTGVYTVSWPTVKLAQTYSLEEADNPAFSSPTQVYNGTVTSWGVPVPGKIAGVYHYRVRGYNTWGCGGYSNVETVTVLAPETPVIDPINNDDGDGSYTVSWSLTARTTNYVLQEDTDPGFGNPQIIYQGTEQAWSTVDKEYGTYYYRVQATGPTGESEWSNTRSVTVTPPPPGVTILTNHSHYIDSIDYLHIVGEVLNNTGDHLRFVKITANIYNSAGQLLDNDFTYIYLDNLPAYQKTCFHLLLSRPAGWSHYQFESPSYWTDGTTLPNLTVLNDDGSYDPTFDWYDLAGEVRNDSGRRVEYVSPVGTLYNAFGTVIGCDFTYVDSTHLDPGQTSSFEMTFVGRDYDDVARYRLQVDGNQR